jgi:hypothetical protein
VAEVADLTPSGFGLGGLQALERPTLGAMTLGAVSLGTGVSWVDAGIGAGVGYLIAPESKKVAYAVGGGLATGLAGLLGLGGLLVVRYVVDRG